jgi:hypothetical protein
MLSSDLLQSLTDHPVLGVSMSSVSLLRLDRAGGLAPGNKSYKLAGNISLAFSLLVGRGQIIYLLLRHSGLSTAWKQ